MSYTRVSFRSVIDEVLAQAGQSYADLTAAQVEQVKGFINRRLRDWAWIGWQWPETTLIEQRRYRDVYAGGTAYSAPTTTSASEVYYPPTQQYYQALRATTGNAPATLSGGTYSTNSAYWALCGGPYSGPDWADATAYTAGTVVRNPANGRYYQCHTAHTSSSSLDGTKFGILTVFDPYVARDQSWETNEIGDFLGMYLDNPELERNPRRLNYFVDSLGAHVRTTPYSRWGRGLGADYLVPNLVYAKFRLPCPDFRGAVFSGSATYTGGSDTVYFAGSTTDLEGDFWACVTTTTAGESPETASAKWRRLEFPAWLRTPVSIRAYADWLRNGSAREAAMAADAQADDALFQVQLQQSAQQGQFLKWRMNA